MCPTVSGAPHCIIYILLQQRNAEDPLLIIRLTSVSLDEVTLRKPFQYTADCRSIGSNAKMVADNQNSSGGAHQCQVKQRVAVYMPLNGAKTSLEAVDRL